MPGFDRTGPMGEGPMTGGSKGRCNPRSSSIARSGLGMGRGLRRGYGQGTCTGRGYGRGQGRRGFSTAEGWSGTANDSPSPMNGKDEINMLKNEADALNSELGEINRRIQELERKGQE